MREHDLRGDTMTTPHEEAKALTVVIDLVRKQCDGATEKKKRYFEATSKTDDQSGSLEAFFGQASEQKKNQAELTKWTKVEREYQLVLARLTRLLENAKRRSKSPAVE